MKQSDIWLINLDPTVGSEIKKTRPVVIVSDDALGKLPLKIIVPFTDWKSHYSAAKWMVEINLITKINLVNLLQQIASKYVLYQKIGL